MQLLPRTARSMARSMRLRRPRYRDLLDSETNIRLGIRYLRQVQERYDGHPVLATAAYNAGARNVRRWLPETGNVAADVWIETVPFRETRDYLKRGHRTGPGGLISSAPHPGTFPPSAINVPCHSGFVTPSAESIIPEPENSRPVKCRR